MPPPDAPRIAVAPDSAPTWMVEAVNAGGGHVVALTEAEGIVWGDARNPEALAVALDQAPAARWVQLPFAGVENFAHLLDDERVWACGKGVYAEPVAELALTLGLAGLRGLATFGRASSWQPPQGRNLLGARVTILGGRWYHHVARPPPPALPLPHHGRSPSRRGPRRGRRRARRRPLCRCPARRRSRRLGPRPHGRDGGPDRHRRARPDGGARLAGQRGAGQARGHRRPRGAPCATASSAVPVSTSPIPSRCHRSTRCGRCPTASSRPTSVTRPRWPCRCSPSGSRRT